MNAVRISIAFEVALDISGRVGVRHALTLLSIAPSSLALAVDWGGG
jgi:hypothetical protein